MHGGASRTALSIPLELASGARAELPDGWPAALGFCRLLPDFLTPSECQALIARAEALGFGRADTDYPPSYRDNERVVLDDTSLAAHLFARLELQLPEVREPQLPEACETPSHAIAPQRWARSRINERLRFCRYRSGQQFQIHQDGVYFADDQQQSRLTFMIYLTDGSRFEGGDTVFYRSGPSGGGAPDVVARVRPRRGMLILFEHALWHAGEPLTHGQKYVLRSDVIYRRSAPSPSASGLAQGEQHARTLVAPYTGHRGYVWALAQLPDAQLASGGRDAAIRLWDDAGQPGGTLHGHTRSVLGLASYTAPHPAGSAHLASVSRDRTLRLWNLATRSCLHQVQAHDGAVLSVIALPQGLLATAGADGTIKLWDRAAVARAQLRGHRGWVWELATLDDHTVASASEDGTVKLWDLRSLACLVTLPGQVPLRTLSISPDRRFLLTGDRTGRVRVWTDLMRTPHIVSTIEAHGASLRSIRHLTQDTVITAGEDFAVRAWHVPTRTCTSRHAHGNFATALLRVDSSHFLSSSYDGTITRRSCESSAFVVMG
jgi:WD40 repeat protein